LSEEPSREPGLGRIEAFSDGVFAIAITLLALDLRPPPARDAAELVQGLLAQWPAYAGFGVSFLLIGVVWINHRVIFSYLVRADHWLVWLNLLLLLNVVALPFTTDVLAGSMGGPAGRVGALLYGGWLTVGGVAYNGLWRYACAGGRLVDPRADPAELRQLSRLWILGPILYAAASLLALVSDRLSLAGFAAMIVLFALPIGPVAGRRRNGRPRSAGSTDR
jgi:uncharacterized membrane protein